ncbi:MAG: LTA synthase family protein [Chitinophagaceae bacterium]
MKPAIFKFKPLFLTDYFYRMKYVPKNIKWVLRNGLLLLLLMTFFRLVFFLVFKNPNKENVLDAFLMGLRFDIRIVAIPTLAIWILSCQPFINPFKKTWAAKFWNIIYQAIGCIVLIVYTADFGHYAYLHQRLNASVLSYTKDAAISTTMVWQSYPVIRWVLGAVLFIFLFRWVIRKNYRTVHEGQSTIKKRPAMICFSALFFVLLAAGIFGRIGQFPLRWSDAQELGSDYKASLAMNPFQSFASTLAFKDNKIDMQKVKQHYQELAAYFGVVQPNPDSLNFSRTVAPRDNFSFKQPNIVLVICESFSAYKSSMYGNPLNTTPYFNSLCSNGIFFERCFTPCYGTARGVWATITGIPDVTIGPTTNTRNPEIVNQHTIINDFKGYEKFYFIGGSASWANIRGLLKHNIDSLHLYEQDDYEAPKIDVWGISDKNVFLEANKVLAKQTKPFFSVIQTADNHRPYTIPEEDRAAFKKVSVPKDSLAKYGFETEDEFNAFRYTDFCYQQFIEAAKKESYFDNTIFVFVGDHGIRGNAADMFPKVWTEQGLTCQHVPLLFYAPKILPAKRHSFLCSQLDILPTIAGLSRIPYTNTSFGTDILDPALLAKDSGNSKRIFIFDDGKQLAGTAYQRNFYEQLVNGKTGSLYNMHSNEKVSENDSLLNALHSFTEGWLEWAKYLPYHNGKR